MKNKKRGPYIDNKAERQAFYRDAQWNKNYREQNRCKASDNQPTASPMQKPPMPCSQCGGKVVKGLFRYACPTCHPFHFQKCGICGAKRLWCCC